MIYNIIIILLLVIIVLLSMSLTYISKNMIFFSKREKDFINFTIDIYCDFGEELGVESKEEHNKLVEILREIQNKHLK